MCRSPKSACRVALRSGSIDSVTWDSLNTFDHLRGATALPSPSTSGAGASAAGVSGAVLAGGAVPVPTFAASALSVRSRSAGSPHPPKTTPRISAAGIVPFILMSDSSSRPCVNDRAVAAFAQPSIVLPGVITSARMRVGRKARLTRGSTRIRVALSMCRALRAPATAPAVSGTALKRRILCLHDVPGKHFSPRGY